MPGSFGATQTAGNTRAEPPLCQMKQDSLGSKYGRANFPSPKLRPLPLAPYWRSGHRSRAEGSPGSGRLPVCKEAGHSTGRLWPSRAEDMRHMSAHAKDRRTPNPK